MPISRSADLSDPPSSPRSIYLPALFTRATRWGRLSLLALYTDLLSFLPRAFRCLALIRPLDSRMFTLIDQTASCVSYIALVLPLHIVHLALCHDLPLSVSLALPLREPNRVAVCFAFCENLQ